MSKMAFGFFSAALLATLHIVTCALQDVPFQDMWKWFVWGYTGEGLYAGFSTLGNIVGVAVVYGIAGAVIFFKKRIDSCEAKTLVGGSRRSVANASGGCLFLFIFWLLGVLFCNGFLGRQSGFAVAIVAYTSASIGLGWMGHALCKR